MHTVYYFTPSDSAASVGEFLATCRSLPALAGEHLASGWFEPWLRDQGRDDLANRAAKLRADADALKLFLKSARPTQRLRKAA
jgi:hypothetical protein